VGDLGPLAGLLSLQWLDCSETAVADLIPLAGLQSLRSLDCSQTAVADLGPLAALQSLRSLDCSQTAVADLGPLAALQSLQWLDCSRTQVSHLPDELVWLPALKELRLFNTRIRGIPPEVLSQHEFDNCLERVRAHLRDLEAGEERLPDVKVLVLGNGRIGKTQICRRLRDEPFEPNADSTHGIRVTSARLSMERPATKPGRPRRKKGGRSTPTAQDAQMHLWDFGGQDVYHGTHALFMRTRSLFVLVWTPLSENTREYEYGGMTFRNYPLAFWLEYLKHLSGTDSPVLLVQNMCDRPEDEWPRPPLQDEALQVLSFRKALHYSARENRKRGALDEAIRQAIQWLWEQMGQGCGRNLM
jgi:internalin A